MTILKGICGLVAVASILYCLMLTLAYINQRRLVFGASRLIGQSRYQLMPVDGMDTLSLTTPLLKIPIDAIYAGAQNPDGSPDPHAATRPTIVFFYGTSGSVRSCASIIANIRRLDINIAIPEYPGYGDSGGTASEEGCYDAADAVYDFVIHTKGAKPQSVFAAGWSLGTGVATYLASKRPLGGLILCSPFTSIVDMAAYRYPLIPKSFVFRMLQYKFPTLQRIGQIPCPIFIAHGDCDHSVPYSMSGQLILAARAPVTFVRLRGVGHGVFTEDDTEIYPSIAQWIGRLSQDAGSRS